MGALEAENLIIHDDSAQSNEMIHEPAHDGSWVGKKVDIRKASYVLHVRSKSWLNLTPLVAADQIDTNAAAKPTTLSRRERPKAVVALEGRQLGLAPAQIRSTGGIQYVVVRSNTTGEQRVTCFRYLRHAFRAAVP
ncbi:hypothetical protein GCM10007913_40440 [Devosia yakushimensis]|uniref:Uncharacterized protein n=1 Tax=Devosia yakushimensis TaxID=470028 RepID=A0ABQ5UJ95_9HYPH|nr:hypothetical protein GCM10007913_40440 [Devosia yakushimensis]